MSELKMTSEQWMDALAHAWDMGWEAAWSPLAMQNRNEGPNPYRVRSQPKAGELCHRHWSWLCQAGQGECAKEATQ